METYFINPFTGKPVTTKEELWKYVDEHRSGDVCSGRETLERIRQRKAKYEADKLSKSNTSSPPSSQ